MVQTVFTGGADDNQLDASAFTTTVVLRGLAGRDILIGGSGADRIDGGLGADLLQGGAGNDQFFVALGKDLVAGQYDIIEGGTGNDELIITLNSAQLGTAEMKTELARLKTFFADHGSDPTAHFTSDVLHVDLSGVEAARLRVDGVVKTLAEVLPAASPTYVYVGSYAVSDGGAWWENPPVYSAKEAAAHIFGGQASDYAISVSSSQDLGTITGTGWYDGWGQSMTVFDDDFKQDAAPEGYYEPSGDAWSAYVSDHVDYNAVNYVWKIV